MKEEEKNHSFRDYFKASKPNSSCAPGKLKMEMMGCNKDSLMKGVHAGK